jgi:glycosyltransferase involved in cell wall biosynthesis
VRILVISHLFPNRLDPTSGIFVLEQLRALRELGVEATVIVPTPWIPKPLRFLRRAQKYNGIPSRSQIDGFTVEYPRVPALPASYLFVLYGFFYYARCRYLLRSYIKDGSYDLIHAHMVMPDGFGAALLGREFGLPIICTMHGEDINDYPLRNALIRWATAWTLRRMAGLIAVSADIGRNALRLAGRQGITVAHNGADADQFTARSKLEARAALGIAPEIKVVLFVGYLVVEKSIEDLLSAFAALPRQDTFLYIVGDGYMKSSLVALAKSLRLADKCIFAGYRAHEEIPAWLSAADCLVLSSTTEGLPTILAEAMMCRVPVVATAVGGVPEIVTDGVTGYLVPPKDSAALAKAIATVLDSDGIDSIVGTAAAHARAKLTWNANARTTLAVYRDVLSVRGAANSVEMPAHPVSSN